MHKYEILISKMFLSWKEIYKEIKGILEKKIKNQSTPNMCP